MEHLELRWKSEMTIKWFSLNVIAGTLANPLDYIKHLGCVLGLRMDRSVVVSPSCDLAGKELGRHLPVRHILPPQLPHLLVQCFPYKVMQYSERTATNSSHQTVAPELWWSPSVPPHKYSLTLALSGPAPGFFRLLFFFFFFFLVIFAGILQVGSFLWQELKCQAQQNGIFVLPTKFGEDCIASCHIFSKLVKKQMVSD